MEIHHEDHEEHEGHVVMPGVTVGENAVVGAHSFVNRDVADGVVVLGVPARTIKRKDLTQRRKGANKR